MRGFEHALILTAVAVAGFFGLRWDSRRRPYTACIACRGRKGRNPGSTDKAWGRCPVCGGSGQRRRVLAIVFGVKKGGS
jgi:DnaJ-class molecular chaperone